MKTIGWHNTTETQHIDLYKYSILWSRQYTLMPASLHKQLKNLLYLWPVLPGQKLPVMQHISVGLVSNLNWEFSTKNLKFRVNKVDVCIYSAMFTKIISLQVLAAASVFLLSMGGYLREVCSIGMKLLLKHKTLFSSKQVCGLCWDHCWGDFKRLSCQF